MQSLIFHLRQFFLLLSDMFLFPFRKTRELWADPSRGRALLFGMPAFFVALISIVTVFLAMGSQKRFIENYEAVKNEAVQEQDWAKAIVYMRKLVQFRPEDDATKWELAKVLSKDDREETAETSVSTANAIRSSLSPEDRPRYSKAHIWRASQYLGINDSRSLNRRMEIAEQQLNFALASDPDSVDARILLAEKILIPKGRQEDYEAALEIYVELFDQYVAYYVKIAELFNALKRPEEATPYLEAAIVKYDEMLEETPGNVEYLRRRANAAAMLGRHDEGAAGLLEAIDVATDSASRKQLARAMAQIYLAKAMTFAPHVTRNIESRESFLENLILAYQTDPENSSAKIALTRYGLANFDNSGRALDIYDPRDNPEDAPDEALQAVGTYEVMRGDRTMGIQLLNRAIQYNPRNHEALNNLAYSLMESDLPRALKLANQAIGLVPRNFQYLDTSGNIYMRMGEYAKAINDLEKAMVGMKEKVAVYEALVKCYTEEGMISTAASFQKKVDELRVNGGE